MAISRFLMNRQLQANGGIMQIAPRENFGLGSKLKKFVRKIIPNEVADIAVKAAPFIAPFNPAVAAAMSGLGTFDQTGSISAGLKSGAMNYGGGQLARYAGGAGFQGNPFGDGGAFTGGLEGFKGGFSSPIGTETGLGKFFSNRGTEGVQGIDMATGGADGVGVIQDAPTTTLANANELSYVPEPSIDMVTGGADGVGIIQDTVSENMLLPKAKPLIGGSPKQMTITESIKTILSPNSTMGERGGEALNLLKRTGKAAFTKEGKNGPVPDKAAILGAIAFAGSYAEAKALAAETGVDPDLTEIEYNELAKADKQEEYAGYLTNFFGGKKDGGRIGFAEGTPDSSDNPFFNLINKISPLFVDEDGDYRSGLQKAKFALSDFIAGKGYDYVTGAEWYNKLDDDTQMEILLMKQNIRDNPERYGFSPRMKELTEQPVYDEEFAGKFGIGSRYANGGRIGYEDGTNEYITRRKKDGGLQDLLRGIDSTIDESDQKIIVIMTENGPQAMTQSEFNEKMGINNETKSIVIDMMNLGDGKKPMIIDLGKDMKKGGRVSRKFGSPKEGESEVGIMTIDVEAGDDEDKENDLMAGITFSSAEKSYLFRRLGGAGGSDRSYTMPQLYRILGNPDRYASDAAVLKEIAIMGMKADGGRIGFKDGKGFFENLKSGFGQIFSGEVGATLGGDQKKINEFLVEDMWGQSLPKETIEMIIDGNKKGLDIDAIVSLTGADVSDVTGVIDMLNMNIEQKANGGRIGLKGGSGSSNRVAQLILERDYLLSKDEDVSYIDVELESLGYKMKSEGGVMDVKMPTGQIRKNNAGVVERDYRDEGGFVPVGIKERADDVPAMLSKNEFVMTADAVRGIGNGSVEEGSKKLYNTMKQAEKVGKA